MRNQVDIVNTSRYPLDEIRELVKIARGEKRHGHVALNVKNCSGNFSGTAYPRMPSISARSRYHHRSGAKSLRYLVVARIGRPENFPSTYQYPGLSTAPTYELRSWQEAFVTLVSHELMHCVQFATDSPRSEIEAERAAVWALDRYRKTLPACEADRYAEVRFAAGLTEPFSPEERAMIEWVEGMQAEISPLTPSETP